jgi:uncharacterized DUF497 family protein
VTDELARRVFEATGFEWDDGNVEKNWQKHRVRSSECEELFFRRPWVVPAYAGHSSKEERFAAFGQTALGRLLCIVFTFRGGRIRVISSRDMSRRERREYLRHEKA